MRSLALLTLLVASPGATGCSRAPCVVDPNQPSCADRFEAQRLAAFTLVSEGGTLQPVRTANLVGEDGLGTDWSLHPTSERIVIGFPDTGAAGIIDLFQDADACPPASTRSLTYVPDDSLDREHTLQVRSGDCADDQALFTGPADFGAQVLAWTRDDGTWDLWVSAPDEGLGRGSVWRFDDAGNSGSARSHVLAGGSLSGEGPGDALGTRLVRCGDLDQDGLDELAIGMPRWSPLDEDRVSAGAVVILSPETLASETWTLDDASAVYEGAAAGDRLGEDLRCDADLTGDGVPDLVIGSPGADAEDLEDAGTVYGLRGGRLSQRRAISEVTELVWTGSERGALLGTSLAVRDLTGDGAAELIAGAPGSTSGADGVAAIDGGRTGAVLVLDGAVLQGGGEQLAVYSGAVAVVDGITAHTRIGTEVAAADLDGDEVPELMGGAWQAAVDGDFNAGEVRIWRGDAVISLSGAEAGDAAFTIDGDGPHQQIGRRLEIADVDADGTLDLLTTSRR